MTKSGSQRRYARRMRERGIEPVSQITPARPRVNTEPLRKQTAVQFIGMLQAAGQVPSPCPDGLLPARFGDWVWLMQFENGAVVGVITIHLSEVEQFKTNLDVAAGGVDFAALMQVAVKAEEVAEPMAFATEIEEGEPGPVSSGAD